LTVLLGQVVPTAYKRQSKQHDFNNWNIAQT